MIDLTQALGAAADAATATRPTIAAGPVLQRIRRRRTVRVATESAVGVAAAGAVAFAGVQLAGRDEPVPPATPTPTATPTPSPTPTAEPTPAVVTATGDLACGLPVPTLDDPAGDADVHLVLEPATTTAVTGAEVQLAVTVVNGTALTAEAPEALGPRVLAARDGVVVGALVTPTEFAVAERLAPGVSQSRSGLASLAACSADGSLTGDPLAPGSYDLYAAWRLGVEDEVVGGPWTLAVEEAVDPHPALADLVVSTSGLGPLTVGLPPEGNPGAAMIAWDPDYCAEVTDTDAGRWVETGYADDPDRGEPGKHPFTVAVDEGGTIGWIDVFSAAPRTVEGVGLGTTVAELQAAYPGLQGPYVGPLSRVWWVEDAAGVLVFETQGDEDGLQPAGTPEQVILVRVLRAGADPQFATANSDWVAGGCL